MNVSVGGETRTVTIPAGSYTKDQLAEEITDQLKGKTTTTTNSFSGYGQGKTGFVCNHSTTIEYVLL